MKLKPVFTEKSLNDAKRGNYTFHVDPKLNKHKIKIMVEKVFNVEVSKVRTMNEAGEEKRDMLGRKKVIKPKKKAIVSLKGDKKLDVFEEAQ